MLVNAQQLIHYICIYLRIPSLLIRFMGVVCSRLLPTLSAQKQVLMKEAQDGVANTICPYCP